MEPAAEKPPTFWKRWFGQTVDPKAGMFRHEVLARLAWGLGVVFSACVLTTTMRTPHWLVDLITTSLICAPEIILRRAWKLASLIAPISIVLLAIDWAHDWRDPISWVAALGAWYGLLAGFGSRSLLACLLALPLGSCTGWWAAQRVLEFNTKQQQYIRVRGVSAMQLFIDDFERYFIVLMPIYLVAGLAVWLGMKYSKRKSSEGAA